MKKIIPFILLFTLFSCGSGGGTTSVASNQPSTQPAAITFKNVPESLSMIE